MISGPAPGLTGSEFFGNAQLSYQFFRQSFSIKDVMNDGRDDPIFL